MQTNDQGDVILSIGANTAGARNSLNSLKRDVQNVYRAFGGQGVSSPQLDKLNAQAEKSVSKIEELKSRIASMKSEFSDTPTTAYQALIDKSNMLEASAQEIEADINDMKASTIDFSQQIAVAEQKLEKLREEISGCADKMTELENNGEAYVTQAQAQPEAVERTNEELNKEETKLGNLIAQIEQLSSKSNIIPTNLGTKFKSLSSTVVSGFKKIKQHAKSSSSSAANSFSDINGSLRKGIRFLTKYGFGVRSFFYLWRKIRTAIAEGYKELVQYSDEANISISNIKSALSKLKNTASISLNAIVQTFKPLIINLINGMNTALEKVNEFVAALLGQSTIYKALNVQEDYAASLSNTADNADKATKALDKYLSPLDDINRYNDNSNSDAADSTAAAVKFTKGSVGNAFKNMADTVKSYFKDIFKPIKDSWNKWGMGTMFAWKKALLNIKGAIGDILTSFKNVWTNGSGERVSSNILRLWKTIGGIVDGIVETFRTAWNKDALGEGVIQSFIDRFNSLLTFIRTVAEDFKDVFENGVGERIWSNILTTVRNINNIIGGFWRKLTDAWSANEKGKRIWEIILGVVEDITGWFKELSDITLDWIGDLDFNPLVETVGLLADAFRQLLKAVGDKLKDAYKNILLPLAKWTIEKAVPTLIEWLSSALKIFSDIVSRIPIEVIKNIAIAIGVLYVAFKALKIVNSVYTWFQDLKASFGLLKNVLTSHPYVLAIMGIVAAITALVSIVQVANRTKWERSDLKKAVDDINEYSDQLSAAADNIDNAIKRANDQMIEVKADISQVDELKKKLEDIIEDGVIDQTEMAEYQTVVDLLELKVDGFQDFWNNNVQLKEIDGEIHVDTEAATKALEDFITEYKNTLWKTTALSAYQDLTTELIKNRADLNETQENLSNAKDILLDRLKGSSTAAQIKQLYAQKGIVMTDEQLLNSLKTTGLSKLDKWTIPGLSQAYDSFIKLDKAADDYSSKVEGAGHATQTLNDFLIYLNGNTEDYSSLVQMVNDKYMTQEQALDLVKDQGINTYDELIARADKQRRAEEDNNTASTKSYDEKNQEIKKSSDETAKAVKENNDKIAASAKDSAQESKNSFVDAFDDIEKYTGEVTDAVSQRFRDNFNATLKEAKDRIAALGAIDTRTTVGNLASQILTKIDSIPYLADGAVLPAGKPFLTILGDQSNGRNLEAPESLLRQIVREETPKTQGGGNNIYNVTAKVNREALFGLIIDEAKLKQNQTGYNPLLLPN